MKHEHKRNPLFLFRMLALFLLSWTSLAFTPPELDEYEMKAMFLINFVKYVDWGQQEPTTPVRIGIAGRSEITPALERIAAYKKGISRPLEIVTVNLSNPGPCHLIFIPAGETRKAAALAKELAGKGILIVTEDNNSSSHAGGINLIRTDNRIRFEINQAAVKLAGLRLSQQLQGLATVHNP